MHPHHLLDDSRPVGYKVGARFGSLDMSSFWNQRCHELCLTSLVALTSQPHFGKWRWRTPLSASWHTLHFPKNVKQLEKSLGWGPLPPGRASLSQNGHPWIAHTILPTAWARCGVGVFFPPLPPLPFIPHLLDSGEPSEFLRAHTTLWLSAYFIPSIYPLPIWMV